jgi:hypothetical protein
LHCEVSHLVRGYFHLKDKLQTLLGNNNTYSNTYAGRHDELERRRPGGVVVALQLCFLPKKPKIPKNEVLTVSTQFVEDFGKRSEPTEDKYDRCMVSFTLALWLHIITGYRLHTGTVLAFKDSRTALNSSQITHA